MRAIIVCGSTINNYEFVSSYLRADDFFIYCDSGLNHEDNLKNTVGKWAEADLIIGDFDSREKPIRETEIICLPREKDDTDSVYAIKEAIKRGASEVIMLGALGKRIDHSLVNIYALKYLSINNVPGMILDDWSENIVIGSGEKAEITDEWDYFSLISICGNAKGVTVENAKFLLENGSISSDYQYATSNEVLPGRTATVSLKEGWLLLSKVKE